jgi:hypothetical protein
MDLTQTLLATEKELFEYFIKVAKMLKLEYVYDVDNYLWIKGKTNLCLTSHVDTVDFDWSTAYKNKYSQYGFEFDVEPAPKRVRSPKEIRIDKGIVRAYRDNKREILGGDDRCGVHVIDKVLLDVYKGKLEAPHILLFNGEESGGVGVDKYVSTKPDMSAIDLILAIDCAHDNAFVHYGRNRSADKWVESFGWFNRGKGVFSDITVIGNYNNIPSVNLGAGYKNQHSENEYIDLELLTLTLNKVKRMLGEGYVPVEVVEEPVDEFEEWESHLKCCKIHGCYRGEESTCPVIAGYIDPITPCEICSEANVGQDWDNDSNWNNYNFKH